MTLAEFLAVAGVHLLAAMSPGPSFVLSIRSSASDGFCTGAALAVGFGLAAAAMAAAALLGLTLLFTLAPWLFTGLKVVGGLFLVWIALAMWRHAPEPLPDPGSGHVAKSPAAAIWLGMITMLANPKGIVFFGAVFAGLLPLAASAADKAIVIANVFVLEVAWYLLVAGLFSRGPARAAYARWKTWADRSMGAVLGALGLRIALP